MKKKSTANELLVALLFILLGVGLVYLTKNDYNFYALLPLQFIVILCGYYTSWSVSAVVGIILPVITSLVFKMPDLWPELLYFSFELISAGVIVSLMYRKWNVNLHITLLTSLIISRVIKWFVMFLMVELGNVDINSYSNLIVYLRKSIGEGILGIAIQLAFIPLLVIIINRLCGKKRY